MLLSYKAKFRHPLVGALKLKDHFLERSVERLGSVERALELLEGAVYAPLEVVRRLGGKATLLDGEQKTYLINGDVVFVLSSRPLLKKKVIAPQFGVQSHASVNTVYVSTTPLLPSDPL